MAKKERHRFIAKVIETQAVATQEELVEILKQAGFDVTQATVSRDIRQMNLTKAENEAGVLSYQLPKKEILGEYGRLSRMLRVAYKSHKRQNEMMVLSTLPGNAPAIANAIDTLYEDDLFTVMSNDNRLLIIAKDEWHMNKVWQSLQQLMEE